MLLLDCSVFSFLLHAVVSSRAHNSSMLTDIIQLVFLFMMSFFLQVVERHLNFVSAPGHFTANRRWLLDSIPRRPACDRSSAAPPLSHAAWTLRLYAVLPALTGRCNRSAACGDLRRNPGTREESGRQTPTDYSAA